MLKGIWGSDWFGLFVVALVAGTGLALFQPAFLSPFNLYVLLISFSLWALVAMAQMVIIAIGQMNLSVGAIGGLVAISFAGSMEVWGLPVPAAILLGLAIAALCGLLNGVMTHVTGISAFVITLATLSIFKGLNIGITEAQPFYGVPDVVKAFGNARFEGLPHMLIVPVVAIILIWLLFNRMVLGRQMLALGANRHAAELSGIRVGRVVVIAHVISALLAAMAGMLAVARLQLGQPTIGDDWLILSFAAPVIGGAVLAGGHISVIGTCLGVVIVTLINNALVLLGIDPFFVQLFLGGLILIAVGLNRWRERRLAPA
ncbi:MAG TPA: ABC transporter permease [Geminicoccaceae bacterium]|nr:ABC transporter permease [Geminicoccaceae bacterium]